MCKSHLEEELDAINKEFHEVIEKKGHCYEGEEGSNDCDCAHYYKKWVETKQNHQILTEHDNEAIK